MVPIANWFVAKRGRALAISIIGLPLGVTIGVPLAEWMIQTIGWRAAWVLFGVSICLVGAPIYSIFMRKDPSSLGLAPDGLPRAEDKTHPSSTPSAIATQDDWTLRQAMRTITFWLLIGNAALSGVALTATLLYRVSFWQSKGMSPTLVAIGTAADPFTVMFSALAFGILAERVPIRYMGVLGFLGFGLSMLPMMLNSGEAWAIFAHNITWGLAAGAAITANNLVWPNYFGTKFLGTIRGMTLPVSVAAGGIGPPLYGFLLDSGVFPPLVFSLSFALLVGAALLFLLARPPVMGQRSHPQN